LAAFSRYTFDNVAGPDGEPRRKPTQRGHDHRSFKSHCTDANFGDFSVDANQHLRLLPATDTILIKASAGICDFDQVLALPAALDRLGDMAR
jgi:hypothetical protein